MHIKKEHLLAVRFAAPREPHEWNGADPSLPDLNPIGFSDCIWLERLPVTRVSDAQLSVQLDPGHERATLTVRLNPETDRPVMERLRMRFTVTDLETGKAVVQLDGSAPWRVPAKPVELAWSNPKLWWPNGAGRPALYRLDCDTR